MQIMNAAKLLQALSAILMLTLANYPVPAAASYTFKSLYSFCSSGTCSDGQYPHSILYVSGNLYGTAALGGDANQGVVFEFSPNKAKYKVLYSFCARANCPDGENPEGPLIADVAGSLYGTTLMGGKYNQGSVFKLTPNAKGKKWKFIVLYSFGSHTRDGIRPTGGLAYQGGASGAPYDGVSPLFGLTTAGGYPSNGGIAFELQPPADKKSIGKWSETVMYAFCKFANCPDGEIPNGSPVVDGSGNVFGFDNTAIFELSRSAKKSAWDFTLLHIFSAEDGHTPESSPLLDAAGNIYGTNRYGGENDGNGTIFKLVPNGASSQYTVLYTFCGCGDGMQPGGGVVMDDVGNLFGTTLVDQEGAEGEVYEFNQTLQVLHVFSFDGSEGRSPHGSMALDGAGNLFGTTSQGGAGQSGTIFELTHS